MRLGAQEKEGEAPNTTLPRFFFSTKMPREVIQSLIVLILLIIIPHIIITILKTVVLQRRLERQLLQLQPVIDNQEAEKLVETILNQLKK